MLLITLISPPLRRLPTPRRFLRRDPHRTSVSDAPFRRRAPISSVCAGSQNRPLDAVDDCGAFRRPAEAAERLAGRPSFVAKSLWRRAGVDDIFLRQRVNDKTIAMAVTEQMDVLLSAREFYEAWSSNEREQVLAASDPELAKGLSLHSEHINAKALNHPHWMVLVESELSVQELAIEVVNSWKKYFIFYFR